MEFENFLVFLNEQPKNMFKSIVSKVDMNLVASESLLNHSQYGGVVKRLLHKTLRIEKKLRLGTLIQYLKSISEKDESRKKYKLKAYTKKCSIANLILILKYANDMNVYDYLEYYDEYPLEIGNLIKENLDYEKLKSFPLIVLDLEIKNDILRPTVMPLVKLILEISELVSIGSKYCLECLKVYKTQDLVVTKVLENQLDVKLQRMDKSIGINDEFIIFYLHEEVKTSDSVMIELSKTRGKLEDLGLKEKQKILYTLEDSEDEYDDTYDDLLPQGPENSDVDKVEQILVNCYNENPEIFHKSSKGTKERLKLIKETGMSDEQLQGWYLMLNRCVLLFLIRNQKARF